MLRLTARFADEWNTWGDPSTVAEKKALLDRACEAEGRDPSTMGTSAQALVFLVDDDAAVEKLAPHVPAGRSIVGTTARLQEVVAEYAAIGIDELIVPDFTLGSTPEQRADTFARSRQTSSIPCADRPDHRHSRPAWRSVPCFPTGRRLVRDGRT